MVVVAPQKNVDDMIYENRARRIAPLQITMVLVGAGFCLSEMKNNHYAIFFAPLSCCRTYHIQYAEIVELTQNND